MQASPQPEFGIDVARRPEPCTARELYRGLFLDLENHVHLLEPAFRFAEAQLARVELPIAAGADAAALVHELTAWAAGCELAAPEGAFSADFLVEVVREFAPLGMSDGAWLHGQLASNAVEREVGMRMLKQLMLRFGGPGVGDSYVERYAALLRSVHIPPANIHRDVVGGLGQCSELSFEHALLPLALGLFPLSFGLETVGFNLWMAQLGPCPLLGRVSDMLRSQGANLRYLALHDQEAIARLAVQAVERSLDEHAGEAERAYAAGRIARGFAAAQRSYQRWEAERFGHDVALEGHYTCPHDPEALAEFAFARYGQLPRQDLYCCLANIDLHPSARLFARALVEDVFAKIAYVMAEDPRLNSQHPPAYSEQGAAKMVAEAHEQNVRSRGQPMSSLVSSNSIDDTRGIQEVFDGCWLTGFVDVQRASWEEYGWMFRIYASEHGDGEFPWNHCQIFRKAFLGLGPAVMLPKTELALYRLFNISASAIVAVAVALNTRRFLPEILGINMSIEATGVGGSYIDMWHEAERDGNSWRALAWRLHNSIDNYADGHTKWSLSAVQSFMRRVQAASAERAEEQWLRVWRLWRCRQMLVHGSDQEHLVLQNYFDPTPESQAAAP